MPTLYKFVILYSLVDRYRLSISNNSVIWWREAADWGEAHMVSVRPASISVRLYLASDKVHVANYHSLIGSLRFRWPRQK